MKKLLALALLMSAISLQYVSADVTGRSFYQPLSVGSQHELLTGGRTCFASHCTKARGFSVNVNGFYQRSVDGSDLARYFLPEGKSELKIRGGGATDAANADVAGAWLQIVGEAAAREPNGSTLTDGNESQLLFNTYSSTLTVRPSFELAGATPMLSYRGNVHGKPWSFTVGVPLGRMTTSMNLAEKDVAGNIDKLADVAYAFNQSVNAWRITREFSLSAVESLGHSNKRFGKISNHSLATTGMGDLFLDAGLQVHKKIQVGLHAQLPTSTKASGQYLFEPVLGNNGRSTLGAYLHACHTLAKREDRSFSLNARAAGTMLFENSSMRTFDLTENGQWSRYLLMLDASAPHDVQSGVNYLTRRTHSANLYQGDLGVGAKLRGGNWTLAAGYNFTARSAERLSLRTEMPEGIFVVGGLANNESFGGDPVNGNVTLAQRPIIAQSTLPGQSTAQLLNGATGQIQNSDLNLASARTPSYLANQVSLTAGYTTNCCGQATDVQLGGNYSFVRGRSMSNMFALFGSISIKV